MINFLFKAHSKYSNKHKINVFIWPEYNEIVPFQIITFAPEQKISYKSLICVFVGPRIVYVGSMMSKKLKLVLMAGLPGVGKSTLAYELSKDLQWYLVNKDDYRKKFLKQGLNEIQASINAYEEAFMEVRSVLTEHESSVILDCVGLHDFIILNVMDIVHSVKNVEFKVILCVVDPRLRKDRLRKRPPERVILNEDLERDEDYFKVYKLQKDNTYILHTDKQIGGHFADETVDVCLAKAKAFLNNEIKTVDDCPIEAGDYLGAYQFALSQT